MTHDETLIPADAAAEIYRLRAALAAMEANRS